MSTVTKVYTFTNGTKADATEVNKDFDDIYSAINGNLGAANLANGIQKSINGIINVQDPAYNASGLATTFTGSITSGTKVLTLTATPDFVQGQGINLQGAFEASSLQVTGAATVSSNVIVTLNGVAFPVAVVNGDTAIQVATKIRTATYAGWTAGGTTGTDTVTFTSNTSGVKTDAAYSAGTTGATGTMTTTTQGTADQISTVSSVSGLVVNIADNSARTISAGFIEHDDTVAIKAAISALKTAGGGTLYFPKGIYNISNHVVIDFDNCHVMGAGIGATIIKVYAWVDGIRVSDSTYPTAATVIKNIIIENLTIDGNRTGYDNGASDTYGNGINLNAVDNAIIRNVHVKDVAEQGIVSTYYSISGSVQQNLVVEDCIIENSQDSRICIGFEGQASGCKASCNTIFSANNIVAIYVGHLGGALLTGEHIIQGNKIKSGTTSGIGIKVEDEQYRVLIESNIVEGCLYSIRCSSNSTSTYDYLIANNYCIDWVSGAIFLFPLTGTDDSKALVIGNQIKSANASGSSYGIAATKNAMISSNRIENGNTGILTSGNGQFINGNWIDVVGYAIDTGTSDSVKIIANYCSTDINMTGTNLTNFGNYGYTTKRWTEIYLGDNKHISATAAPTTGTWKVGDYCKNSVPSVGQPKGWYCTVAGTPGTWVSEGNL